MRFHYASNKQQQEFAVAHQSAAEIPYLRKNGFAI
jgi:hypothetical protein